MDTREFNVIANDFGVDVYGDIFAESGYGISFCFDLATAIYVYAMEQMGHYDSIEIKQILSASPVSFRISPLFSFTEFLAVDIEGEYVDYTSAKLVYDAIVTDPLQLRKYLDALVWYCTAAKKLEDAKK